MLKQFLYDVWDAIPTIRERDHRIPLTPWVIRKFISERTHGSQDRVNEAKQTLFDIMNANPKIRDFLNCRVPMPGMSNQIKNSLFNQGATITIHEYIEKIARDGTDLSKNKLNAIFGALRAADTSALQKAMSLHRDDSDYHGSSNVVTEGILSYRDKRDGNVVTDGTKILESVIKQRGAIPKAVTEEVSSSVPAPEAKTPTFK